MKVEHKTTAQIEILRNQHRQDKINPERQWRGIEVGYLFNSGVVYPTPMGPAIMPNLMHFSLYRGQNKDYPTFIPSIYRKPIPDDSFDDNLRLFYREMQLRELELLINRFPRVKSWRGHGFYVWCEAIAQHYGFYTMLLDITNNFDVALFFACCKYDATTKAYRPLDASDLTGEDEQYGVIYGKHKESTAALLYEQNIRPIGYQPFKRPNSQHSFVCCLAKDGVTVNFDWKVLFKHDPVYSKNIFDEFDGGNMIFTKKDPPLLENALSSIVDAKTFSEEAFRKTAKELNYDERTAVSYLTKLQNKGVNIDKVPYALTRQQIRQIDRDWEFNEFLRQCGIDELSYLPTVKQPST